MNQSKETEKKEEICKMRGLMETELSQDGDNKETMIVVGRSIWDINLETDCLYPVTYVKYAKKKAVESTNKEEWTKAADLWAKAAYKWRDSVQNLKNYEDDCKLESIHELDETADKLTAKMCANLALRYITFI